MKPTERDDLLIRIDERTNNIWRVTEVQEKHLAKINSHLEDHSKRITIVETLQKERSRPSKKSISGAGALILAILASIGKAYGWW